MKKVLALVLALLMIFSLTACGEEPAPTQPPEPTPPDVYGEIDMGAIFSGNGATDVIWGKKDAATRQAIIDEARKDGYDVSFGADGSMTVKEPGSDTVVVQKPDGTWTIQDEDGTQGQLGGNWPDNEFTRLLPKPDMELLGAAGNEDEFTATFVNASLDQIKNYAEKVKAAGFTVDAETTDQNMGGMVIYTYSAKNAAGYTVNVNCVMGTSSVLIQRP